MAIHDKFPPWWDFVMVGISSSKKSQPDESDEKLVHPEAERDHVDQKVE